MKPQAEKKKCSGCKKRRPKTEFYNHNGYSDGLYYLCKPCARLQAVERRKRRPEVYRAIDKRCRDKNKGKRKEYAGRYNRTRRKELPSYQSHLKKMRVKNREITKQLRSEMIAAYGSKCSCCGEKAWEFLTLDHINGDGAKHRRETNRRGNRLYALLKKQGWPKKAYRLLCMNCNFAIGRCGYCPHKGKSN